MWISEKEYREMLHKILLLERQNNIKVSTDEATKQALKQFNKNELATKIAGEIERVINKLGSPYLFCVRRIHA